MEKNKMNKRNRSKQNWLLKASIQLIVIYMVFCDHYAVDATSYKLADSFVGSKPEFVQQVDTRLSLRIRPVSIIPQGSVVELQLPGNGVVSFSEHAFTDTDVRCQMLGLTDSPVAPCKFFNENGVQRIEWTIPEVVKSYDLIWLNAHSVFNNPTTSAKTPSFKMQIYTDSSKVEKLDYQNQYLSLQSKPAVLDPNLSHIVGLKKSEGGSRTCGEASKVTWKLENSVMMPSGSAVTIDFPLLNPEAIKSFQKSYFVDPANVKCIAVKNANPNMRCEITRIEKRKVFYDQLVIHQVNDKNLEKDSELIIKIDSLWNPISMTERDFHTTIASVAISKSIFNKGFTLSSIEEGETSFTAEEPQTINEVEITSDDHTVQTYTDFNIKFKPNIEIESGATVMIQFPYKGDIPGDNFMHKYFDFDARLQDLSTLGGLFGKKQVGVSYTTDMRHMKIQTAIPSLRYSIPQYATMKIGKVMNPFVVGNYGPFKIRIFDKDQGLIAERTTGITYEVIAGGIGNVNMDLISKRVNSESLFTVTFSPLHSARKGDTILQIETDNNIAFGCPDPEDLTFDHETYKATRKLNSNIFNEKFVGKCGSNFNQLTKRITINDPFAMTYEYSGFGQAPLQLVLPAKSPRSARDLFKLKITLTNGAGDIIDTYYNGVNGKSFMTIHPMPFSASLLTLEEKETYTDAIFSFEFSTTVFMQGTDYIEVVPPPEVDIPFGNSGQITVIAKKPMDSISTRLEVIKDGNGFYVKIMDFISLAGRAVMKEGSVLNFKLQSLRTPLSTKTSSSFKVYTKDSEGRSMNYIETDVSATMQKGKAIKDIKLTSSSYRVGDLASHSMRFSAVTPLKSTDNFLIMFPTETSPPLRAPGCRGEDKLQKAQECTVVQNIVKTKVLNFKYSVKGYKVNDLIVGDILKITIDQSNNTKSEETSSAYKLYILDDTGHIISEATDAGNLNMKLTMTKPALITRSRFGTTDDRQLALSAYDISWITVMPYPAGSFIVVDINSDEIGPKDARARAKVRCYSNLQLNLPCKLGGKGFNQLTLKGVIVEDLPRDNYIGLLISNIFTHVVRPLTTKPWEITVYTKNGKFIEKFAKDKRPEFTFLCSTPCETCAKNDPSTCYSCNVLTGKKILYDGACWESCPPQTYFAPSSGLAGMCKNCNPNCLECSDNQYECLSCNKFGEFPFLDGVHCKAKCPFGTYGNRELARCMPCQSPCQSCNTGPFDCGTCDIKSIVPFFQKLPQEKEGKCQEKCDDGYTVPLGYKDFTCQQCSQNCRLCLGSLDNCQACKTIGRTYLSYKDNTCHFKCPPLVTVEKEGKTCRACTAQCKTCSGDTDSCLSCVDGFFLYKNECIPNCQLHIDSALSELKGLDHFLVNHEADNTCKKCDDSCLQCEIWPGKCTKCKYASKYLFDYTCVDKCPNLYEEAETQAYGRTCVLTGLICPFGYEYNRAGDGCILSAVVCTDDSILNYDKNKCVPVPGFLLPFPLTIIGLILLALIAWDKKKNSEARFYPTVVCALGILETVGLLSLIGLARDYGIQPSFYLAFCGFVFLYGLNIFFTAIYFTQLKKDSSFKYWEQEFPVTTYAIVSLGFLANFKIFRMFYSRFQGRKEFDAVFTDELILYRTITFTSVVYILTVSLPILVASIFGLVYIQFGYQLHMFCVEMTVIEVAIFIIMSIELHKIRKHILERKQIKVKPREMMASTFLVRAGPTDDADSGSRSGSLRPDDQKTLQKLIQRINVRDAGKRNENEYTTIKEIQDLHEKEFREHQMRRCISFRDMREYQDEKEEFQRMVDESDSDDQQYNWISEPNSPRSKEMLLNPYFNKRMNELSKAYFIRDKYDNCYHQAKPLHQYAFTNCKVVSRTVQTNVLELLGVDDLLPQHSRNHELIEQRNLLNQKVDEEDVYENEEINEAANLISRGMVNNVLDNFEGFQEKKKRRKLPPARMRQLPAFEVKDLIGNFEIDEDGNFIIIRNGKAEDGATRLEDKTGRRVNQRGYYINDKKQVLTRNGAVVFRAEEVDADGEIPAPFCYQKNKDGLGLGDGDLFGPNGMQTETKHGRSSVAKEQDDEDDFIEAEFNNFKRENNLDFGQMDAPRSYRSMGSEDFENQDAGMAPSQQIKRNGQPTLFYNPNDEDFIREVAKPKPAKPAAPAKVQSGYASRVTLRQGEPATNTSIDPDFLLNGNLGGIFQDTRGDANADDGAESNRVFGYQTNADLRDSAQDLGVTANPYSFQGLTTKGLPRKPKRKASQKQKKKPAKEEVSFVFDNVDNLKKMDREQEILEGIERFQSMLQRYPLKPKQQRTSNTLANKNLTKVYGKIKQQYQRTVNTPDQSDLVMTPGQNRDLNSALESHMNYGAAAEQVVYQGHNTSSSRVLKASKLSRGVLQIVPIDSSEKARGLAQIYSGQQSSAKGRGRPGVPKQQTTSKSYPTVGLRNNGSNSGSSAPGGTAKGPWRTVLNNQSVHDDSVAPHHNMTKPLAPSGSSGSRAHGSPQGFLSNTSSQAEQKALIYGRSIEMVQRQEEKPADPGEPNTNLLGGGYL